MLHHKAMSLAGVALLTVTTVSGAFQPRTGHWNNVVSESGRGFNIDIQDGVIVLTMYAYDQAGNAQWYISSGSMTNGQRNFTGTLDKFVNGQCVTCSYRAPSPNGNDETVSVAFTSETNAVVTLPDGHVTQITPFNFKYGNPPNCMLGEWVFVYDIITTFADRYDFSVVAPSGGYTFALDNSRHAGCELETTGAVAGYVLCVQTPSSVARDWDNAYSFKYEVDETFSGNWIAPNIHTLFSMKGFRIPGASGYPKSARREDMTQDELKLLQASSPGRAGSA